MDEKRSCKRKHSEKEKSKSSKHKKKKSTKYKKYSDSSDASTNSDSSSSVSSVEHHRQKHKFSKNNLKHKRRKSKHDRSSKTSFKKKKSKKKHKEKSLELTKETVLCKSPQETMTEPLISDIGPMPLQPSKHMAPMTKDEWEKQQSVIRRVYDPETGRNRLVKGDGEILEEIVSRERHKEINKMATFNDGEFFKAKVGL